MSESKALKDYINRAAVTRLGEQIKTAQPKFPLKLFVATASRGLSGLEFTARTQHVARSLRTHLPADVRSAFGIIRDCLPPPLTQAEGMFSTNFWLWPLSDFVRDFGAGHWSETMATCHVLTQCFTAEFAIRPQLQRAPKERWRV
jgi:3-methyladenine DNA glycosylase AlkC